MPPAVHSGSAGPPLTQATEITGPPVCLWCLSLCSLGWFLEDFHVEEKKFQFLKFLRLEL